MTALKTRIAVVGAGLGGLACAMDLAARGYRVTLFEAEPQVGGKMRTVDADGLAVDSGPTVFTMRWIFDALFADCGTALADELTLKQATLLARHGWDDGSELDLFADLDASVAAIGSFAGAKDAAAYLQFVRDSGRVFDVLDHSFMRAPRPNPLSLSQRIGLTRPGDLLATRPFTTLNRELARRFSDPRLVQLFGRYATYCGSSPFAAPATLMLIAEAERRGVWYVDGGMQQLAQAMARQFQKLGGSLRTRARVSAIVPDAKGRWDIEAESGPAWHGKAVVFAGDTQALASGLLGAETRAAATTRPANAFSLSAVTLSARASWQGRALSHHTVLFSDDYRREFDTLLQKKQAYARPTVYLCAPDAIESAPQGAGALFCLANAPAGQLGDDTVDAIETALKAQLARFNLVVHWTACTRTGPNEFAQRFPGSRGALYGRSTHGWFGSFARPGSRSRMPGLYLAGASVHPGAGIPMATQSGRLAAAAVAEDLPLGSALGG